MTRYPHPVDGYPMSEAEALDYLVELTDALAKHYEREAREWVGRDNRKVRELTLKASEYQILRDRYKPAERT